MRVVVFCRTCGRQLRSVVAASDVCLSCLAASRNGLRLAHGPRQGPFPERRSGLDRRSGFDRRVALVPIDHPDRRCGRDRRSGSDRRRS